MMKIRILIFCCLLALAACNRDQIKVSGRITNADKAMLYLDEVDIYESRPADSMILNKNGRFHFTFNSKIPCFYQIRLSGDRVIVLFPSPGQKIKIDADAEKLVSSLKIDGSHDTEQVTKLIKSLHETKSLLDSIGALFATAETDSVRNRLNKEYQDILEAHRKFSITFLLTNYNSLASVYALYQQYQPGSYVFYKTTDLQFFKIISDSLAKYIPTSKHVKALIAYTNNLLSDYKSQLIMQKAEHTGASLPKIELPDLNGDTISLESLKGRYVLLSFWASFNEASVSQNLEFKRIYNRYKSRGFEIFQVSFDNSADDWKNAVRYDELPWISVIDAGFPNTAVAGNFNVTQLPANYLIDRDNVTILAKNLTPHQLQLKLSDLFN